MAFDLDLINKPKVVNKLVSESAAYAENIVVFYNVTFFW